MSMPKITDELGFAILASLNKDGRYATLDNTYEIIKDENPVFYRQLTRTARMALDHPDEDYQRYMEGVIEGMGLMYMFIRGQMEADEMNEAWGGR